MIAQKYRLRARAKVENPTFASITWNWTKIGVNSTKYFLALESNR
jgi:hypothetical protein